MTSFMEFMFCINRHIRKFILFQCQDGARGGAIPAPPPVATPLPGMYGGQITHHSLDQAVLIAFATDLSEKNSDRSNTLCIYLFTVSRADSLPASTRKKKT